MKRLLIALLAALTLAGCGAEVLTVAATQAELQKQAAQSATRQLERAGAQVGRAQVRSAIDTYHAVKGHYPPALDTLVPDYLPALPTRPDGTPYAYDPATGQLGPAGRTGPDPRDLQTMAAIRQAINRYGHDTGYYPPSLDALAPDYLPAPPRTVDGRPFVYNNQNGHLALPPASAGPRDTARPRPQPPPAGGMAEGMTGQGVRRELQDRPNPGTGAGGSYGRRSVDGVTRRHNERAQEALGWGE